MKHVLWLRKSIECQNIACLSTFFLPNNNTKNLPKITKQRKHLKPSLSIETYRKKFLSTSLSFHSPRTVAAFLRVHLASCHRLAFLKTLEKNERKKETVFNNCSGLGCCRIDKANKRRVYYCCVHFLK